jgi:MFS family permease
MLLGLPEPARGQGAHPRGRGLRLVSPASARLIGLQALAGGTNAFGMGFVSSMFVVWMSLRFHVGADAIGPVFMATYLLTAISYFPAARVGRRIGSVRAIVASRLAVVALTVATALSPTFLVAAVLQVMRSTAAQMITPVRQAFTMGLYPSNERASAAGMTGVARRLPASISPTLAGLLMNGGMLELPFYLGAGLLLVSAGLYHRFFAALDEPGGRGPGTGTGGGGGARCAAPARPGGGARGAAAEPGQHPEPAEPLVDPFEDI